jgi:hypothetical protein
MLHLGALSLTAVAAAMLMAPAPYQRQAEPGQVSDRFVAYPSALLTWAMVPLMLGPEHRHVRDHHGHVSLAGGEPGRRIALLVT